MPVSCAACPIRKRDLFRKMSQDDVERTQRFKAGELTVDAGTQLLMEGSSSAQLFTALSGMGLRYKTLEDGRRQVVNLIFPGDFIGLQAGVMGEMGHSVETVTEMTLCVFDRSDFFRFFANNPERGFDIVWLAATEEHFLGEALATVGQRDALASVAWSVVKITERARALGLMSGKTLPFPYRQQDLADALGLSLVHTNKTLARLRERQLVTWADGALHVHDIAGLAKVAGIELGPPPTRPLI